MPWDGTAGKRLHTHDESSGYEFRTQAQQEALKLHFAQNLERMCLGLYKGANTDANAHVVEVIDCSMRWH